MKLTIGIVPSRPTTSFSQPHLKMATDTPRLAPMLSRMPKAALIVTRTEQNTSSSSIVRPITMAMSVGSAPPTLSVRSMLAAVGPAMEISAPVEASVAGTTSLRRLSTRSSVSSDAGPLSGITGTTAVSPASLTDGSPTAKTPGDRSAASTVAANAASRLGYFWPVAATGR